MTLGGLIELVSLFQNIYAKPTFLCLHWVKVIVILCGSFTSQIGTGQILMWFSDSRGIYSPQCWEPGFNTKYTTTAVTGYWTRAAIMPSR